MLCLVCQTDHELQSPCSIARTPSTGDALLGTQLGSFHLVKRLGGGGMGTVYLGQHVFIGSKVAVKVLHPHLANVPELVARFQAEALAANLIGHENIVSIFDLAMSPGGTPYLVMEYLEGTSLLELCRGPVAAEVALPILAQVCDGLEAAHARGVVHRDLKPENIFLVRTRTREHFVKLLDFGIAQLLDAPTGSRLLSSAGLIAGTPEYRAPEQSEGAAVDGRADLYALGVIAYLLATGELPLTPRPPHEVNPAVSERWSRAILKAIAKRPEDRYQDAGAFRRALQTALRAPTETPLPAPAPRPAREPALPAKVQLRPVSVDDAFAAAALDEWASRMALNAYGLLGCREDCAFDDLRARAREAHRELDALGARPLTEAQRAALAAIQEHVASASELLQSPSRRAEYDAARGNYRGVARCIAEGVGARELEEARSRYLATRHRHEAKAQAHAAMAQAQSKIGREGEALRELERALESDPLNLSYHQRYWTLCRRSPALAGGRGSADRWR